MSDTLRPSRSLPRPLQTAAGRLGAILATAAAGVVLGLQYVAPNKRVIAVVVALLMFGVTWRIDMVSALGVLVLALPFPRFTVFGSTNLAFVLMMLIIWLLRVAQHQMAPPRRSPADIPILALFICYVVSFYNIASATDLALALRHFEILTASMLMLFVIVNALRTEADLRRLLYFQAVAIAVVCLLGMWELARPGSVLIPGWIDFGATQGQVFSTRGVRPGSMFFDFELFSEYCALSTLTVIFLLLRARSMARRALFGGLLIIVILMLFATCTRGSIVALSVGLPYFLWLVRRRLTFVGAVSALALGVVVVLGMEYYVTNFTRSGSVFDRLSQTRFVGYVPDTRVAAWASGWERIWEHPLIGHGPYYSSRTGTHIWYWPHNLYLYVANNVGFIGLAVFFWLLITLLRVSWPRTDDLVRAPLAKSYLLVAHVQLVVFAVDQIKIEFLRNDIYQFQVWLMFALLVAAHQIARAEPPPAVAAPEAAP